MEKHKIGVLSDTHGLLRPEIERLLEGQLWLNPGSWCGCRWDHDENGTVMCNKMALMCAAVITLYRCDERDRNEQF